VVLDCSAVIDIEYTALKMLIEAEGRLRAEGIALWLAALNPEAFAVVQRSTTGRDAGTRTDALQPGDIGGALRGNRIPLTARLPSIQLSQLSLARHARIRRPLKIDCQC